MTCIAKKILGKKYGWMVRPFKSCDESFRMFRSWNWKLLAGDKEWRKCMKASLHGPSNFVKGNFPLDRPLTRVSWRSDRRQTQANKIWGRLFFSRAFRGKKNSLHVSLAISSEILEKYEIFSTSVVFKNGHCIYHMRLPGFMNSSFYKGSPQIFLCGRIWSPMWARFY